MSAYYCCELLPEPGSIAQVKSNCMKQASAVLLCHIKEPKLNMAIWSPEKLSLVVLKTIVFGGLTQPYLSDVMTLARVRLTDNDLLLKLPEPLYAEGRSANLLKV